MHVPLNRGSVAHGGKVHFRPGGDEHECPLRAITGYPNSWVGDTDLAGWVLAGRVGADEGLHKFLFLKQQNASGLGARPLLGGGPPYNGSADASITTGLGY